MKKANMRWGTTDEQLLQDSHRKKPSRRGKNKPQTATLISMHVLRFAQLHSDWSLHDKPVRMKQNCSLKVRETPLLPPLKKEQKNGKLKHHILPFSDSADHIRVHSSLIPAHFSIFRCHSGSFRYIPVPFLSFPFHSVVILPRSGIFRLIPVYSVPFHSVPVFSNVLGRRKALDNIDLNLVSHRYVSGVLKDDHFVSARSLAPRF